MDFIELHYVDGMRTLERVSNICSIDDKGNRTAVYVNYILGDDTNFYFVADSYDSVKARLIGGEANG